MAGRQPGDHRSPERLGGGPAQIIVQQGVLARLDLERSDQWLYRLGVLDLTECYSGRFVDLRLMMPERPDQSLDIAPGFQPAHMGGPNRGHILAPPSC